MATPKAPGISLDEDRVKFIQHAERFWSEILAASSKGANAEERANARIVARRKKNGEDVELLSPLLDHQSSQVRLASAAYLVKSTAQEKAIAVLRDLSRNPVGLVADYASTILRVNEISVA
jgi:hypothetical protein